MAVTSFNIAMTLIWLPLIGVLVKIVMTIIPDNKTNVSVVPEEPKYLDDYLASMFAEGVMTEEQANNSTSLLYVLCDIDRIGSLCREITEDVMEESGKKARLSKEALKDLKKSVRLILDMYTYAVELMETGDEKIIKDVQKKKEEVMSLDEKMRKNHIGKKT